MIWDAKNPPRAGASSAVLSLADEIRSLCGSCLPEGAVDPTEVAKAVVHYLENDVAAGPADSRRVVTLACRALSGMGQGHAARRLLVFGGGLVRPAEWEFSGDPEMWTLDLKQMAIRDDMPLEMFFYACLDGVLECIADVWDGTGGKGLLGLRHVCGSATALLGGTRNKRRIQQLADEIMESCIRRLRQFQKKRGWTTVPSVVNLDI